MFSGKLERLVDTLAGQGVAPALGRERIHAIVASPGYRRIERRIGEARLAAKLEGAATPVELVVRDRVDDETLLREHWIRSRPLLLTDALGELQGLGLRRS